jgi:elongation factor Ts
MEASKPLAMTISASTVMELRSATGAGLMDCKQALVESDGDLEQARDYLRKKGISVAAKKSSRETTEGGITISYGDGKSSAAMVRLASETDFVARNDQFLGLLNSLAAQVLAEGDQDVMNQQISEGETVQERITVAISTMGENLQLMESIRVDAPEKGLVGGYVHSNAKIGVLVVLSAGEGAKPDALEELARDLAMHVAASQVHALRAEDIDPEVIAKEKEIFSAQARESGKPDEIVQKMVDGRMNKFVREVSLMDQPFVKDPDKTIRQVVEEAAASQGVDVNVERFVKFQF